MTEPQIIVGEICPDCYRKLQQTNTGFMCRRCGHTWDKIVEPDIKQGLTDKQEVRQ